MIFLRIQLQFLLLLCITKWLFPIFFFYFTSCSFRLLLPFFFYVWLFRFFRNLIYFKIPFWLFFTFPSHNSQKSLSHFSPLIILSIFHLCFHFKMKFSWLLNFLCFCTIHGIFFDFFSSQFFIIFWCFEFFYVHRNFNKNTVASFSIFSVYWLSFLYYLFLYISSLVLFFLLAARSEQNDEKKRTCYVITVIMVSIYNILIKSRVCFFFLNAGA